METRNISISEAANLSGIPVEEIWGRIWHGELPGTAMPSNRQAGTVSGETVERLVMEGRGRIAAGVVNPAYTPRSKDVYRHLPMDQAAAELGIPVRDLEWLLVRGELEGPVLNHRHTGVDRASLAAYQDRQRAAEAYPNARKEEPTPSANCAEMPPAPRPFLQRLTDAFRS
jgi:hypothetical protein